MRPSLIIIETVFTFLSMQAVEANCHVESVLQIWALQESGMPSSNR